jgi:hypothetical protein
MTWGEAVRLTKLLLRDSSSQIAASAEGWKFPIDRATLATLDLFDLTVRANSDPKKGSPKPHGGRPFEVDDRARQSIGKTGGRSRAEIVEILRGLGHNIPV